MGLWPPSLVIYWVFCNVIIPLFTIPLTIFFLWLAKKTRLIALISDGQLCLYGCSLSSSAIYDISRVLWESYEQSPGADSTNTFLVEGLAAIGVLSFLGLFLCGGAFVLLTFLSISNRFETEKEKDPGFSDEQKLSIMSIALTSSSIFLVIQFRLITGAL